VKIDLTQSEVKMQSEKAYVRKFQPNHH